MARVVRRKERDIHLTDHGKRAELRRAETEEVELMVGVGFVTQSGRGVPDAARVGGRSRASDNEQLMLHKKIT